MTISRGLPAAWAMAARVFMIRTPGDGEYAFNTNPRRVAIARALCRTRWPRTSRGRNICRLRTVNLPGSYARPLPRTVTFEGVRRVAENRSLVVPGAADGFACRARRGHQYRAWRRLLLVHRGGVSPDRRRARRAARLRGRVGRDRELQGCLLGRHESCRSHPGDLRSGPGAARPGPQDVLLDRARPHPA